MGVFDYKGMKGDPAKALLSNALALSEYAYDSTGQPLATGGWAPIGAQALGVTQHVDKHGTFWGETAWPLRPTSRFWGSTMGLAG